MAFLLASSMMVIPYPFTFCCHFSSFGSAPGLGELVAVPMASAIVTAEVWSVSAA